MSQSKGRIDWFNQSFIKVSHYWKVDAFFDTSINHIMPTNILITHNFNIQKHSIGCHLFYSTLIGDQFVVHSICWNKQDLDQILGPINFNLYYITIENRKFLINYWIHSLFESQFNSICDKNINTIPILIWHFIEIQCLENYDLISNENWFSNIIWLYILLY